MFRDSSLRAARRIARAWSKAALATLVAGALACAASAPSAVSTPVTDSAPFESAFPSSPFPPPLAVNGGFCEYRRGHFHAGFDLGTDRRIGRPVIAPIAGSIERMRASGVGYGRSVYLRADDGRLLVFAHLDAFSPVLADYVRGRQDSAGVYEQDLWPEAWRFRFAAGDTLAWSGESGAGGPHLHLEVRRQDMAYHPQRAGLMVPDSSPPTLVSLTLEPLDEPSRVAGSQAPRTFQLERPETVEVVGRLRAIVGARDGVWAGVDRMVPWEVGMEWDGQRTLVRFDSVSWASDMEEGDYVFDAGRVVGDKGIVLWAPQGFRPRVLHSDAPSRDQAGSIRVRPGQPARELRLWARDVGGGSVERRIVLRSVAKPKPLDTRGLSKAAERWADPPVTFASLPGGIRMSLSDSAGLRAVDFQWGGQAGVALRGDSEWAAFLAAGALVRPKGEQVMVGWRQTDSVGGVREVQGQVVAGRSAPATTLELRFAGASAEFPAGSVFEGSTLLAFAISVLPTAELAPLGEGLRVEPAKLPLRKSARIALPVPAGASIKGVGLYRRDEDGWQWLGAAADSSTGVVRATSRQLGAFAVFRDTLAPRVPSFATAGIANRGPYSRWAYEATVEERGSGVDARACWFEVDGRRVPVEWDPEAGRLRWRPATRPVPGRYGVTVVAADRAGNQSKVETTLVVES